jgi:hypothetical protein
VRWMTWMVVAASLAWLAPVAARAQVTAPEHPLDYGLFALERLQVGPRSRIDGAVGVNDGEARIGRRTTVAGVVAADVIRLGRRVKTEGVTCTLVVGGKEPCVPLIGQLVPQTALEVVQVVAGPGDVIVPRHARRVALAAGSYRRVRVGRGSSLTLAGGDYDFQSLDVRARGTLACAAACRVRVTQKVVLGRRARIESADATDPALVRIDVEGRRTRTALRIGSRARVAATLYGPTVAARVGRRVRVAGSVVARTLRTGARTRVTRP